jgi:hypothetical protein
MRANEARKNAVAASTGNMKEIYHAIKVASKKGDMEIFRDQLFGEQIQQLQKDGYKVEDVSERNDSSYRISWAS